jgi:hypothetical protein
MILSKPPVCIEKHHSFNSRLVYKRFSASTQIASFLSYMTTNRIKKAGKLPAQ